MKIVKAWTDGSCNVKNKLGGIGSYIICENKETYISKGYSNTTVSRMELRAIIQTLQLITDKDCQVIITSDSQYTVNSIEKGWLLNWENEGFVARLNSDLWKLFLLEYRKFKIKPKFIHCRGHQGIYENEVADRLCDYKQFKEFEKDLS